MKYFDIICPESYIYIKKEEKAATKEILSWCREHRLTISHSREWTLLPSLTSESGRPDTAVSVTPGTETTSSVLPLLVTHQITLCSPLPSSFPSSSCIPLLPSVWPFTPPASSSFNTRRHSFSSPSLPLALPGKWKCFYSITGRCMCRVSIRFHVLVNKCCQLPYARVLDSPDNTRVARHRVQTVQFSHTEAEGTVWTVTLLARTQPMSVYAHMQAH